MQTCRVANELESIGAILFGDFKLSSGMRSTVYVDLRKALSHPTIYRGIVLELAKVLDMLKPDAVVGIATAGIPWAAMLALTVNLPLAYVRLERKQHGRAQLVEGDVRGKLVAVVDDVATTGQSIASAVEALRAHGARVSHAVVVVDRCQGAARRLKELGVTLLSLYQLPNLLRCLKSRKAVEALAELNPVECSRNPFNQA
jgi:orotate phosphoribosyltransferase